MRTEAQAPVFVLGGMNMDLIATPAAPLRLRESNPGRVALRPGGVGRNIAAALAALGVRVELVTILGEDAFSPLLAAACAQSHIGLACAPRLPVPGGAYFCLHEHNGDMLAAVNQMEAMAAFTPAVLAPILPALQGAAMLLADTNLPEDTLCALARGTQAPLALDTVSCAKARRALPILDRLLFIKPNRYEAEALTGIPCDTPGGAARAAGRLLALGTARVYLSLGPEGLYYADADAAGRIPAPEAPAAADFTGAGDRLTARLAYACLRGGNAREAAEWAMRGGAAQVK